MSEEVLRAFRSKPPKRKKNFCISVAESPERLFFKLSGEGRLIFGADYSGLPKFRYRCIPGCHTATLTALSTQTFPHVPVHLRYSVRQDNSP